MEYYITITGIDHYYGKTPFKIGCVVALEKDYENEYDSEAIKVMAVTCQISEAYNRLSDETTILGVPHFKTVGYVANSVNTVITGTMSAGRLYDKFENTALAEVMFITKNSVIAKMLKK